jgi:fructose-1-phosphate kinase PfkB-like protein
LNIEELKALAPGSILKIKQDGKHKAGHGVKLCKVTELGGSEVLIQGVVTWISNDRLEK